jgi:hypothetical protein
MRGSVVALMLLAAMARGAAPPTEKGVPKGAKLYALLVGVNDYSKSKAPASNLVCSIFDAAALAQALRSRAHPTYSAAVVDLISERDATAKIILRRLAALTRDVRPEDRVVILFAGHALVGSPGVAFTSRSGREYKRPVDFQFVCRDSDPREPETFLLGSEFLSALKRIKGHVLVVLNLCHSGALCKMAPKGLAGGAGRYVVIAAAREEQSCLEPRTRSAKWPVSFFMIPVIREVKEAEGPLDTWLLFQRTQRDLPKVFKAFDPGFSPGGVYADYAHQPTVWPTDPAQHWPIFQASPRARR